MPKFYSSKLLTGKTGLKHAFTTSAYGNLSWQTAKTKEKWEETAHAHVALARDFDFDSQKIVSSYQSHGKRVAVIGPDTGAITVFPADGLVTNQKNVPIMVHTADCSPVLMYDPIKKAVAAVHAGWRGVLNGVTVEAIMALQKNFDSKPKDIIACVGPRIGSCHFEVKEDVWEPFKKSFTTPTVFREEKGKTYIDMGEALREQLLAAGLLKKHIEIMDICTYCDKGFSSYRRDGLVKAAMGNIICLM